VIQRLGFRLAALIALALLPLGLISLVQAGAWRDAAREQRAAVLMGETLRVSTPTTGTLREAQGAAAALARTVRPLLDDETACDAAMSHLAAVSPQYSVAAYVPLSGRMTCAANGAEYDYSGNPQFKALVADLKPTIAVNPRGPVSGSSVLLVIHPVIAEEGGYSGYVVLAMPHSALDAEAAPGPVTPIGEPDYVTLNGDGLVLTASVGLDRVAEVLPADADLGAHMDGAHASFTAATAEGQERFYAMVPLIPGQLFALGSVPVQEAVTLGPVPIATPFLLAALMWAGSLVVAWVAAEQLVIRYIRRLGRAIGAFASGSRVVGDLDVEGAPAEIREVGRAFLRMTDTILHDEAELENTVHQREVLLREVHHRVKNNLQLIASIMNMQMRRAKSPETKALMRGLQERVMSLATVHKELYQTSGLADVRADELLGDLVRQIVGMASGPGRHFRIETDFAPIPLTPDQAVPLALLLAEGLTNAIKYAAPAPGEAAPRLALSFTPRGAVGAELVITNTVPAEPPPPSPEGTGLGSQLVTAFASQLGGEVNTSVEDGLYTLRVEFALTSLQRAEERHGG
jgi:two-component sensor histidine kinase